MSYAYPKFIQDMADALTKAANGIDQPPHVEFHVDWVEVTTMDTVGRAYKPVITFNVTVVTPVDFDVL